MINKKTADIAMIITAIIWGTGFIGTEIAIEAGAKTSLIVAMRFVFAGIILLCVNFKDVKTIQKSTFKIGVIAGVMLFLGFYFQASGQAMTTVSNSSFLTATNVVIVPFLVWAVTKKPPSFKYFVLAFTTLIGASILTMDTTVGISFNQGDFLVLCSAFCFAIHIVHLSIFAKDLNSKQMTFLQMMTIGVVGTAYILIFERSAIDFEIIKQIFLPTMYLATFCSCVCYYLQTTAQKFTTASKAGLFLGLEGLFGSVFSVMLGMDKLTTNLFLGGTIIIASVILSEINFSKK
ncbi:MAG: DMT family transporter [Clostridia bacterium]